MNENTSVAGQVINYLLDIEAIKLNLREPFTWASGWKSPIYCDNRVSLSYPYIRTFIKRALTNVVNDRFKGTECIAGVATAGIPQGVLVANNLDLPFIYVRSKPKGHGLTNQIEGKIVPGQKVVVIEDLVSTGGSSLDAVGALKEASVDVLGMAAIFTYGFEESYDRFRKEDIAFYSLSDYNTLLEVALSRDYIRAGELDRLKAWRDDPSGWR